MVCMIVKTTNIFVANSFTSYLPCRSRQSLTNFNAHKSSPRNGCTVHVDFSCTRIFPWMCVTGNKHYTNVGGRESIFPQFSQNKQAPTSVFSSFFSCRSLPLSSGCILLGACFHEQIQLARALALMCEYTRSCSL